jgi:sn-glycerol 3-phosphate transport system permease protein
MSSSTTAATASGAAAHRSTVVLSPPAPAAPGAQASGPANAQAPADTRPPQRRRPMSPVRRRRTIREGVLFCLLILPNLAAILVFSYWPALYNIVLSFMDWDLVAPMPEWVGLENYVDLFTDPDFWTVMLNTLVFTTVTVVGSLVGGVLLGSLLATKVPFTGMVRTFAFAPHMLPGAAVGMLWLFMFDPSYGLSRWLFGLVGMDSPQWTTTSDWSLAAVTVAYLWQRLGFVTVIYYTAILDLPRDVLEAASLDGAHGWRLLRYMVLPLLSPITFFLSVTGVIAAAQAFDLISILTGGGPGISSSTLSWMIYEEAFQKFDIGRASSAATVLLVLLLLLTFVQVRFGEKKVNYAS